MGVSPDVNIYGLKVLNDEGEGATSTIIDALDIVLGRYLSGKRSSIVSMSLGGPCDSNDCTEDPLVIAVEALAQAGIISSVAAGNEGCNGCYGSPNSATRAVNVGATDITDTVAYFSNYGQCIDIYAPGYNILSACANATCGNSYSYIKMSGTSMATPHVAGVIAQILQQRSNASWDEISTALSCGASKGVLSLDSFDTISRNLLLQVPVIGDINLCERGEGCPSDCSFNGMCMPSDVHGSINACYCDSGYYGETCDSSTYSCSSGHSIEIFLDDTFGDGWSYSSFAIYNASTGLVVDNAFDSLCYGSQGSKQYCLDVGLYTFEVTSGLYPEEVSWSFCDVYGGAPTTLNFYMNALGKCEQICDDGALTILTVFDSYGDGSDGGYYGVFNEATGNQMFGGILNYGSEGSYSLCLPAGCYFFLWPFYGYYGEEISFELCGLEGLVGDVVRLCIDPETLACEASQYLISKKTDDCVDNQVTMFMFDLLDQDWSNIQYEIYSSSDSQLLTSGTMKNDSRLISSVDLCLKDGCYPLHVEHNSSVSISQHALNSKFWSLCGYRGPVPSFTEVCLESTYGLCYGLSGTPIT